ncbi:MAG: hypothetical protein ACPHER_00075 [Nevskiales bacterium]
MFEPARCALFVLSLTLGLALAACAGGNYHVRNLAKSDMSYVADTSMQEVEFWLRELAIKLYKRNPREVKKGIEQDPSIKVGQIFAYPGRRLIFAELNQAEELDAMLLGLDPDYKGDRVFAVMVGLTGMLRRSYGYQQEYFLFDSLDAQGLYNSARNIEVLVWRLKKRRTDDGKRLLLTNSRPDEPINLSYERLFGRLIGIQDLMARMAEDRSNRTITKVVQSAASAVFLPIP